VAERAALVIVLALLLWAPWPLGSNRPWAWAILEVAVFLAAACWIVGWMRGSVRNFGVLPSARPALYAFAAWIAYLLLQWIPLPELVVRWVSPTAWEVHRLAAAYSTSGGAWMTLSVDPHATFVFWLKSCAYALAFALTLALANTSARARLIAYTLVAGGILQAAYGALMHLAGKDVMVLGTLIPHSAYAAGGFVNRNHLAGCLELALAMGIGLMISALQEFAWRGWRRFWRDMAGLLLSSKAPLRLFLVVMVVGLVMTRSRMGNVAFFSSLLIAGVIALALSRHATRSTVILIASLIVIDVLVVGAWFGVEQTLDRIGQTSVGDVGRRAVSSEDAYQMVRDYPVFGTGAGTFYTAYSRYRGPDVTSFYDFAHNDYMQFLVETGVIGLLLVGSLPVMALGCAVLSLARRRDALARGLAFAVVMGVSALAIHSTVDFNLQIPANALAFVVLLAFGWISLYLNSEARATSRDPAARSRFADA
jgi:putative inorganic carbon (HCO3(-)) transporter